MWAEPVGGLTASTRKLSVLHSHPSYNRQRLVRLRSGDRPRSRAGGDQAGVAVI